MDMPPFTPRNVSKIVVNGYVRVKATQITSRTICDHTQLEKDDLTVRASSGVVAWYIGEKTKPYTDRAVDFVADKYAALKQRSTEDTSK
jgi:hypothetical protein